MQLQQQIEAILFYMSEAVSIASLVEMLALEKEEGDRQVREALEALRTALEGRGIRLVWQGEMVQLSTAPEVAEVLEGIANLERKKDLGKAGLETLTIILYKSPVSKSQIDYIRGVNSGFILRHLLVRGLIERLPNPHDKRTFLYGPTIDTLAYLGLTRVDELPGYDTVAEKVAAFQESFSNDADDDDTASSDDNDSSNIPT